MYSEADIQNDIEMSNQSNVVRFKKEADDVFDGVYPSWKNVEIGLPSTVLAEQMESMNPVYIVQSAIKKAALSAEDGGKHGLGKEVVYDLPLQLADPMAITRNTSAHEKSGRRQLIVWTDWITNEESSVIIPIRIDITSNGAVINNINTVFDADNDDYVEDLLRPGNVLYTRDEKDIRWLLSQQRQLLKSHSSDASYNSMPSGKKVVKIRPAEPRVNYSSTNISSDSNPFMDNAMELHNSGVRASEYENSEEYDPRVGNHLRALQARPRTMRILQEAANEYAADTSITDYWEKHRDRWTSENTQVQSQLRGMYIRNGQAVGGALGQQEITRLTENSSRWKQIPRLAQNLTAPGRLFENLGAWRTGKVSSDAAQNYVEGKELRRAFFDYGQNQMANKALWMREESNKIREAFGDGDSRISTLSQMLGEGIITREEAETALYDKKHMVVQKDAGVFVFDRRGRLTALSDGGQTVIFDENYRKTNKVTKGHYVHLIKATPLESIKTNHPVRMVCNFPSCCLSLWCPIHKKDCIMYRLVRLRGLRRKSVMKKLYNSTETIFTFYVYSITPIFFKNKHETTSKCVFFIAVM